MCPESVRALLRQRSSAVTHRALAYYEGPGIVDRLREALREAGLDPGALNIDDLAQFDEFHALGRAATLALAKLAGVQPGNQVLDVIEQFLGLRRIDLRLVEQMLDLGRPVPEPEAVARLRVSLRRARVGLTESLSFGSRAAGAHVADMGRPGRRRPP